MSYLVLLLAAVAFWVPVRDTRAEYRALVDATTRSERLRIFRVWISKPLWWWGIGTVVGLALLGQPWIRERRWRA